MRAYRTTGRSGLRSADVRVSLVSGGIGGFIGAMLSSCINGALVGLPSNETANMVNHAISGLASGFFAGFAALLVHLRKSGAPDPAAAEGDPKPALTGP
ncbi:hypothetical protein [Streptomyces sp. H39-S7]|uniref:hypothetical protein n=1 Tax=Streptomyces sp. H39-S7 TaxID=3004357 RepID=UPI0022AF8B87|nr:hypothetical protein [Streptomyces sp. H39-S7]MCZ4122357.1 hypothetical protein [Streptomyces sp. H39-S7]